MKKWSVILSLAILILTAGAVSVSGKADKVSALKKLNFLEGVFQTDLGFGEKGTVKASYMMNGTQLKWEYEGGNTSFALINYDTDTKAYRLWEFLNEGTPTRYIGKFEGETAVFTSCDENNSIKEKALTIRLKPIDNGKVLMTRERIESGKTSEFYRGEYVKSK